ncbi:hypothetical protein TNCV_2583681 [Trichonephila clavipes]|nr:hypothetical protein TNCV_2583681 [Trichonephila clavipes]
MAASSSSVNPTPLAHANDQGEGHARGTSSQCYRGCLYERRVYNFGAEFDDPADPCSECACMKGSVYCDKKPCEVLDCVNAIADQEHCCPYCPDYCEYNGEQHELEAVFPHATDVCKECTCLNGDIHCDVKTCPDTLCLHPAPGKCCLECLNCQFHDEIYTDNMNFTNPENSRETCLCSVSTFTFFSSIFLGIIFLSTSSFHI